ncbi:hypothetical protein [Bradyrhizobium sp. AUGA SZCCT0182]|uniref:hypothetical protein n=1 Tax=Bradyrhizobium sp. AUGA SZCCT0182 TaxID=2807667 RepID=UPI001BA488AC|nr:hypothetical protein [Bradyrhizobium sp. AUGA SZCCT0182]MBR1235621.1 hypothetical protein [Bradyrhizobium sp. AUGA SZCCT0182]
MQEVNLQKLIGAVVLLGNVRAALIMDVSGFAELFKPEPTPEPEKQSKLWWPLRAPAPYKSPSRLQEASVKIQTAAAEHKQQVRESIKSALNELIPHLEEFELTVTLAQAKRFIRRVDQGEVPAGSEVAELTARFFDELHERKFIGLSRELSAFYKTQQFPQDVRLKFPSTVVDIDEAMNCLALERSTASVFHFMRVLEVAVRATASCLGVPNPTRGSDKNWGVMLNAIKNGMNTKWPTATDKMQPDAKVFENLLASLEAVKNPWRNATMHVENTYTMAEAQRIRHAVEGLMITMASRFDENGDPKV